MALDNHPTSLDSAPESGRLPIHRAVERIREHWNSRPPAPTLGWRLWALFAGILVGYGLLGALVSTLGLGDGTP